ncbi:MAG: class I SAM-dependent methyltransferase [Alphaproteobacteria bacterium]
MSDAYTDHPCDICGADDAAEIAVARHYTGGEPLHACRACGFVFVRRRRSAQAIADDWSDNLYQAHYTARIPAVKARQTFVAEFIDTTAGVAGKRVCDIGAGEGPFLAMLAAPPYDAASVFGIEPSAANGRLLAGLGIDHFVGTIEAFAAARPEARGGFDLATIIWTLENCQSCRGMLDTAWDLLAPGGHVAVATGSRILVPFKKPLHYYLGPGEQDTHAFRFSRNSLTAALAASGFAVTHANRDIDHDVLCVVARKVDRHETLPRPRDDWRQVVDFFDRWHVETQAHYADR